MLRQLLRDQVAQSMPMPGEGRMMSWLGFRPSLLVPQACCPRFRMMKVPACVRRLV
jgi:hypothetical protein